MGGPRIWRALGLAALLATCGEPQAGIARASEEIGALVGAELEPVGSLGSTVVDLIGSLSGTDESRPEITRVRVLTDREQRADLEVFVRHAAGGQAWARVLDHEGRALAGLESARVEISGDEVSVQIGLELPGSLPETFEAQSTAVDVYVARAGKRVSGAADTVRRYAFPKRWQARVPPERRVLRVRPEPIGAAARLGVRSRAAAEADEIYPSEGMVPLHPPEAVRTRGTSPVERAHRAMEEARQRQRFEAERARRDAARDRARQKARKRQRDREKQEARDRAKEKAREETARRREQRGRDEAAQRDRAEEQRRRREAAEAARREREEEERRRREELEAAEVEVERLEEELEAQRQLGATGPSPTAAIDPLEGLLLEPTVDVRADEILDVWPLVWLDANPTSGVAYFAPRRFALGWSPEDAYSFQVVYGLAVDDGTADRVRVSTRLRSRVGGAEIQRLQGLIEAYGRRHAERRFEFRELSRLPIRGRELTLTGALERQFSISPEVVTVTTDSDLLGAIDLSWTTDEATLLDIQSLLRADAGIHGSMVVQASGEPAFEVPVPVEIAVATPGVLGRIGWDRRRGWRNDTFYPVRLRYLHALVLNQRHEPLLYSWDLGDANVAAGTLVEWDATRVPSFVDDDALQMWIDYAVDADCESCDDLVFDDRFIPELPASHALRFTSTNAFEASGAFRIVVHVRSLYFDGRTEQLRSVEMRTDEEPYGAGTLYLEDGQLAAADSTRPLYEYRIELITEDGEVLESAQWLPGWRTDQFIGRASLREAFGFVPGEEAAP